MRITFKVQKERWYKDFYLIKLDGVEVGSIVESRHLEGLYNWSASEDKLGIPWKNTSAEKQAPVSLDEAKAQAKKYIKECLSNNQQSQV